MRVNAHFDADKSFIIEGFYENISGEKLPGDIKDREKEYFNRLNETLTKSVKEAADIRQAYFKALENDSRISSQERGDLIKELDEFILSIVSLCDMLRASTWVLSSKGKGKNIKEIFEYEIITFTISDKSTKFQINGKLNADDISLNNTFTKWHDQSFIKNIKEMVLKFHQSIADKVLTSNELEDLYKELSNILYDSILMRYLIQYCLVHV